MIETIPLYNRRETVFQLNSYLGFGYDWHHILMLWTTKSKASYSVMESSIRLFPFSKVNRSPLYLPLDVAKFIKAMRERFPEMARPAALSPALYEVDTTPPLGFMRELAHLCRKAKRAV